ncbi:Enoyl-CoA hydratase [Rhodovulum sp. P5]|uniref:enoyl-CoA hydratase-related protein n=1 Tax=Rhodovulum sp. P5 TaxID=1564506 RepID=UPI0009C2428B|nr:enoyl-CoA hydratase-related protein [Rhodovulum sp. P5]ARE38365.1 Enoyl-CoA hydratase [Rhodovulum sp. P5]
MASEVSVHYPAEGIGRILLRGGRGNLLSADLLAALHGALSQMLASAALRAVLIGAEGRSFSYGIDPGHPDSVEGARTLRAICDLIETATVPVVAALQGAAMGAGFELALAAHFRVARIDARLALPDIVLGVPPMAGATQRLPRLTDPEAALDVLLTGRSVTALKAERMGLVDAVVDQDLDTAALRFAERLVAERVGPRPTLQQPLPDFDSLHHAVATRRAMLAAAGPVEAPGRILDCVDAAAMLPPDTAMEFEAVAYEDCANSATARALHHVARAERQMREAARARSTAARPPRRIGIWGWGPEAASLAALFLSSGARVTMAAPDETCLAAGVAAVDTVLTGRAAKLGAEAVGRNNPWDRLSGVIGMAGLGRSVLVVEAGDGAWREREDAYPALAGALPAGGILAATGPLAEPDRLAQVIDGRRDLVWLNRPDLGLHPGLCEIVGHKGAAPDIVARMAVLMQEVSPTMLVSTGQSTLLSIFVALLEAGDALVEEGASPYDIDAVMRDWGFAVGPYELADRLGLPALLALRARRPESRDPLSAPILLLGQLVADGWTGRAAGRGFYRYHGPDETAQPDQAVLDLAASSRDLIGKIPQPVSAQTIRAELLAAMVQAGAALWRRKAVQTVGEIDLAVIHGLGLAKWRGGPMQAADEAGLLSIRRKLLQMAARRPEAEIWTPDPLIAELIKNGRGFEELTRDDPAPFAPSAQGDADHDHHQAEC